MPKFVEPIKDMDSLRLNNSLHGRSVHRKEHVRKHNVFKGYLNPGTGDAIDLFCKKGEPVRSIADGVQITHRADEEKEEVIYVQGSDWLAVYAHINATRNGANHKFKQGEIVGTVRGDLNDPHLHFELWLDGKAVHAPSPGKLRMEMMARLGLGDVTGEGQPRLIIAKKADGQPSLDGWLYNELPSLYDHRQDIFLVDTLALSKWLNASPGSLKGFVHIRAAMNQMGFPNSTYQGAEMNSLKDPRMYVFAL
jgi:murein DD-endopeptidase MepM/ murein hydrolase activator NlpD